MALPKRIVLTGASGFVGRALGAALASRGDTVIAVSRDSAANLPFAKVVSWEQLARVRDVDAIVHLAGESVAQRWTDEVKARIVSSRVDALARLREASAAIEGRKPAVLVSASAIGFYGDRRDDVLDEQAPAGTDFLARTCMAWEKAALAFPPPVERVVVLRFGLVLGKGGGALTRMVPPFRLGLGGRLGNGRQWVSWIHLDDLVLLLVRSIDSSTMKGIYNAVAPEPLRNAEFSDALAEAVGSKARFPVPEFALRLAMGEMAEMLLGSQRVSSQRLSAEGFRFRYPRVIEALRASLT